jgi:hypothetical protein
VIPQDKPPDICNIGVKSVTVDAVDLEGVRYDEVLSQREWEIEVRTMYKRKDKKVKPVDVPLPGGINPGGWSQSGWS